MFLLLLLPLSSLRQEEEEAFSQTHLSSFSSKTTEKKKDCCCSFSRFLCLLLLVFLCLLLRFPASSSSESSSPSRRFPSQSRASESQIRPLNLFSSVLYIIEKKKRLLLYQNARDVDAINPKNNKGERERFREKRTFATTARMNEVPL